MTDPEDVWRGSGLYTGQPLNTPETPHVFSSSEDDASGESGMQSIRIFGLLTAASVSETSEDIVLNGSTPVNASTSWYRVYRADGLTYGAGGTNAGTITVRQNTTTANIFVSIPPGLGKSQIAAFTVPAGTTSHIISMFASMGRANGSNGSCSISLRVRALDSGGYNAVRTYFLTQSSPVNINFNFPISMTAGSDMLWRVDEVSDNDTVVHVENSILTIDD